MFSKIRGKNFIKIIGLILIGVIGGLSVVASEYIFPGTTFNDTWKIVEEYGAVSEILELSLGAVLSTILFILVAYLIGNKCGKYIDKYRKSINLKDKKFVIISIICSIVLPIVFYFVKGYVFTISQNLFSPYALLKGVFFDSIIAELFFNYGITTLIVFAVYKVFYSKSKDIGLKGLIISVVFSALLVFSIQLNSLINTYTVTGMLLLWSLLQYLFMDVIYAYYYVRYGIKWSTMIHLIFTIILLGICPLCFG